MVVWEHRLTDPVPPRIPHDDGSVDVLTDPDDFAAVRDALAAGGFAPEFAQVTLRSSVSVALQPEEARCLIGLLEALEDLDDVQRVTTNVDIPEDVLAELAG